MNPYEVLGVERSDSFEVIHREYLMLARLHHPDHNGGEDSEVFRQIKRAHDLLMDPNSRAVFDQTGLLVDDPDSKVDISAMDQIRQKAMEVLMSQGPSGDLLSQIAYSIGQMAQQIHARIVVEKKTIERAEQGVAAIESRWRQGDAVKASLLAMLQNVAEGRRQIIVQMEQEVKPMTRALELLKECRYDVPPQVAMSMASQVVYFTRI